jgi:hypothetical protein
MPDFGWVTIRQDTDRKESADAAFRGDEHDKSQDLGAWIANDALFLARDPRAGWALRWYLDSYLNSIIQQLDDFQRGTKFRWGFLLHGFLVLYLFIGSLYVPSIIPDIIGIGRLVPTHARAVVIYYVLLTCGWLTNQLFMRTLEDQLLSLVIPTTTYLVVKKGPVLEWRHLNEEEWFVWTVVGFTCLQVFVVSLRQQLFNQFLKLFFRWKRYDAAFLEKIARVHQAGIFPINKVFNNITRHQHVGTYWEMIWGGSKLSVNTSIRNHFFRETIGAVKDGLELLIPKPPAAGPRKSFWGKVKAWFAEGQRGPKFSLVFIAVLVLAFAIGPFYRSEFVMASATPWGLRSTLRLLAPALSLYSTFADVAKIFAIVVAMGVTDFPFSIALVSSNFTALNNPYILWPLVIVVAVLVFTISDAMAPFLLHLGVKFGWTNEPALVLLPEADAGQPLIGMVAN